MIQLLKKTSFRWGLAILFIAWFFCACSSLFSCNPIALFNPKSYGGKWSNTYLWFLPEDLNTIYVGGTGKLSEAHKLQNGTDYLILWREKNGEYFLRVESFVEDVDHAWFDGFDTEDPTEEIPWNYFEDGVELQSDRLREPDSTGYYHVSLSNDLRK